MRNILAVSSLVLFLFVACENDSKTTTPDPNKSEENGTVVEPATQAVPGIPQEPAATSIPQAKVPQPNSPSGKQFKELKQVEPEKEYNYRDDKISDEEYKKMEEEIMNAEGIDKEKALAKLKKRKAKQSGTGKSKLTPANNEPQFKFNSTCDLISEEFVAKTVGVERSLVKLKDGSSKTNLHARSCFYRWNHHGAANSGVLIQVSSNPMPEEFPDWASYYISAKKTQGDQNPDGSGSYRYKDFPDIGVDGGYNFNLSRYCWRSEQDHVFLVAFNQIGTERQQLAWARKIGNEMMSNFYNN